LLGSFLAPNSLPHIQLPIFIQKYGRFWHAVSKPRWATTS
jgi:hypothetical protein